MIEMERVKIGLQCIIDGTVRCESCGYAIDKHGHHSCQQNCAADALALLKEQEPQLVLNIGEQISCKSGSCPKCGKMLNTTCNKRYCGDCGQAVKWA